MNRIPRCGADEGTVRRAKERVLSDANMRIARARAEAFMALQVKR